MIKLFFLLIFLLAGPYALRADEPHGSAQDFLKELNAIKNPFEDGIPKPVVVVPPPVYVKPLPVVVPKPKPKPKPKPVPVVHVVLPVLALQGVIVGGDVQQAIINDQVVPLSGAIKGAKLISVTKEGVEMVFKGKKFFLKVD